MPKAKKEIITTTSIVLVLTLEEAEFLQASVQNSPPHLDKRHLQIQRELFNEITSALKENITNDTN